MRDFTLKAYKKLLDQIVRSRYTVVTFEEYCQNRRKNEKVIILRHDVDKKPLRSLRIAVIENKLGIKSTYYFRVQKNKLPSATIRQIAKLGNEIGYHYNDLNDAAGAVDSALASFQKNLEKLREVAPVKTACMHGSPMSRFDNRDMWKARIYREFGIIGEPYLDIDFDKVMYLTDTGRRWDGEKVSIRDKVRGEGARMMGKSEDREELEKRSRGGVCDRPLFHLHSTGDIIEALKENRLSANIMVTVHPQRWTDNHLCWLKELLWQKFKNLIKYQRLIRMERHKNK
jgi:hypothetical protein